MIIKKICVITNGYPTVEYPIYTFLKEVIDRFVDNGIECIVINPVAIIDKRKLYSRTEITLKGNSVKVICPRYIYIPDRDILGFKTVKLTNDNVCRAVYRIFRKYVKDCDMIYAHFINSAGIAAACLSRKIKIPCVVACGESSLHKYDYIYKVYNKYIKQINGIVSVSSKIQMELEKSKIVTKATPIIVLPNGVDLNQFKPLSKKECREKLKIDSNYFIVCFTGHFIERKGISVLISALNRIMDNEVRAIFIGGEELPERCSKSLIVKKVQHSELPLYLNASDVFVMPTLNEGCCNAIIEAQACGLPIVTSRRTFNDDIVSDQDAILIDPMNEKEIIDSIMKVKNDTELKIKLMNNSLYRSRQRDIDVRVEKILEFLESIYVEYQASQKFKGTQN